MVMWFACLLCWWYMKESDQQISIYRTNQDVDWAHSTPRFPQENYMDRPQSSSQGRDNNVQHHAQLLIVWIEILYHISSNWDTSPITASPAFWKVNIKFINNSELFFLNFPTILNFFANAHSCWKSKGGQPLWKMWEEVVKFAWSFGQILLI